MELQGGALHGARKRAHERRDSVCEGHVIGLSSIGSWVV